MGLTAIKPEQDFIWQTIRKESKIQADGEPILASFFHATILNHGSLECSLSYHLANKLESAEASALLIREVVHQALRDDKSIGMAVRADLAAIKQRDSACTSMATPFLFYKGFHALQAFRIANWLWRQGRIAMALFFQNRISVVLGVDIHPAATVGQGIMLDHATGIVVGETAVIENDVSIMQAVTLGGTGKVTGDRHPKVRAGVLISAGAKIIGNIEIGEGAKVGAGSVVLKDVPAHSTVAGVPAKVVGSPNTEQPSLNMNHDLNCDLDKL